MERLSNLGITLACLGRMLVRGRPVRIPRKPRRILVVPAGKLGDVVCATPVLRALRDAYPEARIVCEDARDVNSRLLADSGLVDEYLPMSGLWGAARAVRRAAPDAVLIVGPGFSTLAAAIWGGARCIIASRVVGGFSPQETRLYKLLSCFVITVPFHMGAYAPRERLRVLEPFGITIEDTTKHLGYSEAARRRAESLLAPLRGRAIVGISPSAGNRVKEWPSQRFGAVADHCIEKCGAAVVVIAGKGEERQVAGLKAGSRHSAELLDLSGDLSLDELKAVIARLALFIAVDTGPIYIAEALGVATIDIVGPMDEREQPPRGERHAVVLPPQRNAAQLHIMNARVYDEREARRQVESTTVQSVIAVLDALLPKLIEQE